VQRANGVGEIASDLCEGYAMNRIMVIHGRAQYVSDETLETLIDREFERAETARLVMDSTALAHHLGELAKMMALRAENIYGMAA
jgi:hypothetical protein